MERKVLNNKVKFCAGCKEVVIKLSDKELKDLLSHTNYNFTKGAVRSTLTFGELYNFGLYAFLDYDLKKSPSKAARVKAQFPYHEYDKVFWYLQ